MEGTNPDAIEAWAFDSRTFEALLARLAPHQRVVLLSGDVHYSASNAMSYWPKGQADPARIVQFTSSGMKNVMPPYIATVDRSLAPAQQLVRAKVGTERLAWTAKPANPILLPAGTTLEDVPRALRAKLQHEPMLIPTYGWPAGSTVNPATPPDWQWRVEPVIDQRPDSQRPEAARPQTIDKDALNAILSNPELVEHDQGLPADGRAPPAHAADAAALAPDPVPQQLRRACGSSAPPACCSAVHEIYTAVPKLPTDEPKPELFVRHVAALAAPGTPKPETTLQPLKEEAHP